jgi:hypothetical protein
VRWCIIWAELYTTLFLKLRLPEVSVHSNREFIYGLIDAKLFCSACFLRIKGSIVNACRILMFSLLLTASLCSWSDAPPGLDQLEPFPEYSVKAAAERRFAVPLESAAHRILDYQNQCMDCRYFLASMLTQEVFNRDIHPHQFIVWRDVSKEIKSFTSTLQIRSSGFAEVRLYRSSDSEVLVIDIKSVAPQRAETLASQYQRANDPAFSILHGRWTLTRLDPDHNEGQRVHIEGVAGGKAQGIAAMAPKSVLSKELISAMTNTLDFID